ncbi:MAG: thioredoxin family protein, partial [Verrucomicrobiia bacterium]
SPLIQAERPKWNWVLLDVDDSANASLSREFGVRGIPAFFLLSPEGKRLHSFSGARSPDQFAAILRQYAAP